MSLSYLKQKRKEEEQQKKSNNMKQQQTNGRKNHPIPTCFKRTRPTAFPTRFLPRFYVRRFFRRVFLGPIVGPLGLVWDRSKNFFDSNDETPNEGRNPVTSTSLLETTTSWSWFLSPRHHCVFLPSIDVPFVWLPWPDIVPLVHC